MRILLWSPMFWPYIGGVEVLAVHFIRALRERGHEVVVLARRDTFDLPAEDVVAGAEVIRYPFRQALESRDVEAIVAGRRAFEGVRRRFAPDIVHVYSPSPDVLFQRLSPESRSAPVIVTLHSSLPPGSLGPETAVGRALRDAEWLTACSEAVLEEVRADCPDMGPCSVIPNRLPPVDGVGHEPSPEQPVVLFIGRLVVRKGFDLGLSAFATVTATHPAARAIVAGDGPERASLQRRAIDLGLRDAVEFIGWVAPDAVPELMGAVTAVVMPSRLESFGLVALQAGQARRPVVGFRVGGLQEAVADGETGTLVDPGDVSALAAAIDSLLREPSHAEAMGRAGYERASGDSGWSAHVDAYERIYERVLD